MIIQIIIFIASILLYFVAPNSYSQPFVVILLVVFLIDWYVLIKETRIKRHYFDFFLLFSFSFFLTNFLYPTFIYGIDSGYFKVFRLGFNHNVITKATALALLGYSSFVFGARLGNNLNYKKTKHNAKTLNIGNEIVIVLNTLTYISFIIIFSMSIQAYFDHGLYKDSNIPPGLLVIFQILLGVSIIIDFLRIRNGGSLFEYFVKANKPILFILIFYTLYFITGGERGGAVLIILLFLFTYSLFFRQIKLPRIFLILILGMFILASIGLVRRDLPYGSRVDNIITSVQGKNFERVIDLSQDFVVNTRNLYVGYDYVKYNDYLYGSNIFYYLLAPIPNAPSIFSEVIYDKRPSELTSAYIITKTENVNYGLGTNLIIDLYMSFGVVFVIFGMFGFGYITIILHNKALVNYDMRYIVAYSFLVGFSIYMARTSLFTPFRYIVWGYVLYIIIFNSKKMFRSSQIMR